jgi:hypothetical protein
MPGLPRRGIEATVREQSPAGLEAADTLAWYQQTSTYQGAQDTFHRRHIMTPLAKELMNLRCNTCHQGNDPRDEAPETSADNQNVASYLAQACRRRNRPASSATAR